MKKILLIVSIGIQLLPTGMHAMLSTPKMPRLRTPSFLRRTGKEEGTPAEQFLYAAEKGNTATLASLFKKNTFDEDTIINAFYTAVEHGQLAVIKYLLKNDAENDPENVVLRTHPQRQVINDTVGVLALELAIEHGQRDVAIKLAKWQSPVSLDTLLTIIKNHDEELIHILYFQRCFRNLKTRQLLKARDAAAQKAYKVLAPQAQEFLAQELTRLTDKSEYAQFDGLQPYFKAIDTAKEEAKKFLDKKVFHSSIYHDILMAIGERRSTKNW